MLFWVDRADAVPVAAALQPVSVPHGATEAVREALQVAMALPVRLQGSGYAPPPAVLATKPGPFAITVPLSIGAGASSIISKRP